MLQEILNIEPLSLTGILAAMLSGTIIGLERQIMGKPVGVRTSNLICLGTYCFIMVSNAASTGMTDPSRIIGQVVTGIGFLGAGVMLSRDGIVFGVTSASAIWMLAAIGVTIGFEHYLTGIKLAVLTVFILVGMDVIEDSVKAMQQGVHAKFKITQQKDIEREQV